MSSLPALQDGIQPAQQRAQVTTLPAPTGGWNTRDSIANMSPLDALLLDNWIVRPGQISLRRGQKDYATAFPAAHPVKTIVSYSGGSHNMLFAATDIGIYDISSSGPVGAAVDTVTEGTFQHVNFSTSAGQYLALVNGTDDYRYFDGTTWTAVPTFTGSGIPATSSFASLTAYKQRLYFAAKNDLNLYFLNAGAITGACALFPLGQIARRGGTLTAVATWTIDGGSGVDDLLVLATSEGEIIVYSGTDPTNAAAWFLRGVYELGRPMGRRCFLKYGGDLLYLSDRGLYPLSKALQTASIDRTVALTDKINSAFSAAASSLYGLPGWELEIHSSESFLLVNIPAGQKQQYVMDLQSKAWSRFIAYEANCFRFWNGKLFYGAGGKVVEAYVGSSDMGGNIPNSIQCAYNYFGQRGSEKHLTMLRPSFASNGVFSYQLNASLDYDVFGSSTQENFSAADQAVWDASFWDSATWSADYYLKNDWITLPVWPFFAMSLGITVKTKTVTPSLIATDFALIKGGVL